MHINVNVFDCVNSCNTVNQFESTSLVFFCPALILLTDYICFQSVLTGDELSKLSVAEGTSLADQVALTIGQ